MRLPPPSAHYGQRVRYGRYVARRLRRTKRTALAADVETATNQILALGRAVEEADLPVQEAMADRDGADDDLDLVTQNARAALAGRSADAIKKAPYTLIFPENIAYYTAAPLDQETIRYGELKKRLEEHLPADDSLRKDTFATIEMGLDTFSAAMEALGRARTDAALAETRLAAAEDVWGRLLTKVYGPLLGDLGRAAADKFFPKPKSAKKADEETDDRQRRALIRGARAREGSGTPWNAAFMGPETEFPVARSIGERSGPGEVQRKKSSKRSRFRELQRHFPPPRSAGPTVPGPALGNFWPVRAGR